MDKATQKMLDRLRDRVAGLLAKDPDWQEEANRIEEMLDDVDLQVTVSKASPQAFARTLFEDNPRLAVLAERAIKFKTDPYQADQAFDLIENLTPSNRHDG